MPSSTLVKHIDLREKRRLTILTRLLAILYFCSLSLLPSTAAFAQSEAHELFEERLRQRAQEEKQAEIRERSPARTSRRRIRGFNAQRPLLRLMCEYMERDMRRERLHSFADSLRQDGTLCDACRLLYRELASSCRLRGRRPEQAPPAELPRGAREPRIEVLDFGIRAFHEIFAVKDFRQEYTLAAFDLRERLLALEDLRAGEREYFSLLFDYILFPFDEYRAMLEMKRRAQERVSIEAEPEQVFRDHDTAEELSTKQQIDALFEF